MGEAEVRELLERTRANLAAIRGEVVELEASVAGPPTCGGGGSRAGDLQPPPVVVRPQPPERYEGVPIRRLPPTPAWTRQSMAVAQSSTVSPGP